MTLEKVLYTAKAHTTGGRENGAARIVDRRLSIKVSPAAGSSTLIFTAKWEKWYRVLRYRKGFGLFDSVRLGFWLARSGGVATPGEALRDEVRMSA
jgi:hypothetical protein